MKPVLWRVALCAGLVASACGAPEVQARDTPVAPPPGPPAVIASAAPEVAPATAPEPPRVRTLAQEIQHSSAVASPLAPPGPLAPGQIAALAAVRDERIYGSSIDHFPVSNEYRHDLWFADIRGLGGAYVGVASDQNYTLIATARSEIAYLIDLDRQVVDLHAVYAALIAVAPDPTAFMALLDGRASARQAARAAILAGLAELPAKDRNRALTFFEEQREQLAEYLQKVRTIQAGSWLADPEAYAYIKAMFATGRIRVLQGNLLGKSSMASIAQSAGALGMTVKVLYLSNAEEYLFYNDGFAANVRALPAASDSVVLRTIHDRFEGWESSGDGDGRWNYQVQGLLDFQARLADRGRSRTLNRTAMLAAAQAEGAIVRRARGVSAIVPRPVASSGGDLPASGGVARGGLPPT